MTNDDRTVRRVALDGSSDELVERLAEPVRDLSIDPTKDGTSAVLIGDDERLRALGEGRQAAVMTVGYTDAPIRRQYYTPDASYRPAFWPPPKGLRVSNMFWGAMGLRVNLGTLDRDYALETPFAAAYWRSLTLLSKDVFLAELSGNVVLLDYRRNMLARLARGRSPALLLSPSSAPKRTRHWVDLEEWSPLRKGN